MIIFLMLISQLMASTPINMEIPIKRVYAPNGFDSNDNTQIIVSGTLPNLCHKSPKVKMRKEGNDIFLTLSVLYYEDNNPFCPKVNVPFLVPIELGLLEKGFYSIYLKERAGTRLKTNIEIEENTTSQVDEHIYANVENVERDEDVPGKYYILGHNPSSCLELDTIKINYNGVDTYSVMPIMKQVSELCPQKRVPFKHTFYLDTEDKTSSIKFSDRLIHVRVMNGRAINIKTK